MAEEILTGLAVSSDEVTELATPRGVRLALAGLLRQSAPGVPVAGRLFAPNDSNGRGPLQVDGDNSELSYWVNAGVAVIPREGQFGYLVGNPTRVELEAPTADGTHPRIDIVFICQPDKEQSDDSSQAYLDVASGTPAAAPVAPSLPPGSIELARKVVAAGATNTAEGAAFTNVAPMVGVNVGELGAEAITSGTFDIARLPNMPASKTTSGTFNKDRVPRVSSLNGIAIGTEVPTVLADGEMYFRIVNP